MYSIDQALEIKNKFKHLIGTPIDVDAEILINEIIIIDILGNEIILDLVDNEDLNDLRKNKNGYQIILSGNLSGIEITRNWEDYCKSLNI